MRLQVPILKTFEFGRPQLYAGLMLLGLATLALIAAHTKPFPKEELRELTKFQWGTSGSVLHRVVTVAQPASSADEILLYRLLLPLLRPDFSPNAKVRSLEWLAVTVRLPLVIFGLWLGGALWWVSRRLYNNAGGYVALGLYCSSPFIVMASSTINADILAAWGLFGIVYTAIGVAHTLYAPTRKWRPRILLLGVAFGLTAGAHLAAAIIGLILAGFFLLYLAPGRRMASVAILFVSSTIGALILWALYGFGAEITKIFAGNHLRLHSLRLTAVPPLEALPLMMLLSLALATFLAWRRTRYFGNWSALLAAAVLLLLRPAQGDSVIWALPFIFVFIGGMFADLLETERRVLVRIMLVSLIAVQALAAIWTTVLNANLSG